MEKRTLFACGTQRVISTGQETAILPARVANHSAFPLMKQAI